MKSLIFEVRGHQVMLDEDLAKIYKVETRVLNQAVKRNINRFPPEFMFQLTKEEYESLKSQFATSNLKSQFVTSSWGGRRKLPTAFTEHGVVMLSSVLLLSPPVVFLSFLWYHHQCKLNSNYVKFGTIRNRFKGRNGENCR